MAEAQEIKVKKSIKGTFGRLRRSHDKKKGQVHYFCSGSNNMTKMINGEPHITHYTDLALYDAVVKPLDEILEIKRNNMHDCVMHVCTITAIDAARATVNSTQADQDRINRVIWQINSHIHAKNKEMGVKTPWLSRFVHISNNGTHSHWYDRLTDGVHPSEFLLDKWANEILKHYSTIPEHLR